MKQKKPYAATFLDAESFVLDEKSSLLRSAILYIASRSESDSLFSPQKLNRILSTCDFSASLHFGKAITDQIYRSTEHGPAPSGMAALLDQMESRKEIAFKRSAENFSSTKIYALVSADLSLFSAAEVDLLNRVIDGYKGLSGMEPVETLGRFTSWRIAAPGEEIPIPTAMVGTRGPSLTETHFGSQLVSRVKELFSKRNENSGD